MYDLIVLGAGCAGMTASIYAARYKLNHLIFGKVPGGQIVDAHVVENYPGFASIGGLALTKKFREQVESYGTRISEEKIISLKKFPDGFEVESEKGESFKSRTLILAMGARHRALNVPGEKNFLGKGVSYCTTCDAPLFKGRAVVVVGGGDSAVTAALHLASFASKVYLIHRRGEFRAEPAWLEKLKAEEKIELVLKRQIRSIEGEKFVESIVLSEPFQGEIRLKVEGVFIEIGVVPAASLVTRIGVEVDDKGYIKIGPDMATNVPGVYAAGDIAYQLGSLHFRQIITSAAQGALAAASVYQYLTKKPPAPSWS